MNFNKVILVGHLCDAPQLSYTTQGAAVCNFRLAVNTKYRVGEDLKEDVLFVDITVWGKQGESCSQYLNKGSQVLVEGRLKMESWEKDGEKRSKIVITASNVKFMGKRDDGASGDNQGVEPF